MSVPPPRCNVCSKPLDLDEAARLPELICHSCRLNRSGDRESNPPLDRRLPPKFTADDPEYFEYASRPDARRRIFLPDGAGGVRSVDGHVVRIEHQGRMIELKALPPEQRRRRRKIINLAAILLGFMTLLLFFLLAL